MGGHEQSTMLRVLSLVAAIACASAAPLASTNQDHVLKPTKTSGPVKMMVFIPGANVPTEFYLPTVKAIQDASDLQLWVVIPAMPLKKCIITCPSSKICAPLQAIVTAILGKATAAGYNGTSFAPDTFLAGHSLGGVCVDKLAQAYTSPGYQAAIILGAYTETLTGAGSITDFPVPVMIAGAELDGGLGRPAMIDVRLKECDTGAKVKGTDWQLTNAPVVILPKMDHSSFCPGFQVPGDVFPAEATQAEAMASVGSIVSSFLHLHTAQSSATTAQAKQSITQAMAWTHELLAPLQQAYQLEGGKHAGNPATSSWCAKAQQVLAGDPASGHVTVNPVEYKADSHQFEHTRVAYAAAGEGQVALNASGHNDYYSGISNGCLVPAASIDCKMVGAERVAQQLNISKNSSPQCRAMNVLAVQAALDILSNGSATAKATLARFNAKGRNIMFADDFSPFENIGPLFIQGAFKIEDSAAGITVSSLAIHTQLDSKLFPGVHYCKMLSPARVMDYIYTDSLKKASGCLNK